MHGIRPLLWCWKVSRSFRNITERIEVRTSVKLYARVLISDEFSDYRSFRTKYFTDKVNSEMAMVKL